MDRRAALILLLSVAVPLTACGGGGDDRSVDPATATAMDFAGGTCLVLAEDVLGLRTVAVSTLQQDPRSATPSLTDYDYLPVAAARLRQGLPKAGGKLVGPLGTLVGAADAAHSRVVGSVDDPGPVVMDRLRDAADGVISACT